MSRDERTRFHPLGEGTPLLELSDTEVDYQVNARRSSGRPAVDGVTLAVAPGRSLGLVGESGCGKTSLGRAIVGLAPVTGGSVSIAERPDAPSARRPVRQARAVQMVFQDPYASLDPRQSIGSAITEPMVIHDLGSTTDRTARATALLDRVGLDPAMMSLYPHQLSGGQRQRVCIARALTVAPLLLVCDEPTSALDVSIQAQVVELLRELQDDDGLTYLFITHDLALLPQLVADVAVMYLGRIVETGPAGTLLRRPLHPYTVSLLEAVPVLGRRRTATGRRALQGEALAVDHGDGDHGGRDADGGCPFRPRCWLYRELGESERAACRDDHPRPASVDGGSHLVACHHADTPVAVASSRSTATAGTPVATPVTAMPSNTTNRRTHP